MASVACRDCGHDLTGESSGLPPDERPPCPSCGSRKRAYRLDALGGTISITGNLVRELRREVIGNLNSTLGPLTLEAEATVRDPLPDVLLAAELVRFGGTTVDGQLVVGVSVPWFEIIRQLDRDPEFLFKVPWRKLEELIAGAFERDGWPEVVLTPGSGDGGRDVIATRPGVGSVRIVGQVKAYHARHVVTFEEVKAVCFTRELDRASKAMVMTTSRFAPGVHKDPRLKPYIPHQLELMDGSELLAWLKSLRPPPS